MDAARSEKKAKWKHADENRKRDHICHIGNLASLKSHYPKWSMTKSLKDIDGHPAAERIQTHTRNMRPISEADIVPSRDLPQTRTELVEFLRRRGRSLHGRDLESLRKV